MYRGAFTASNARAEIRDKVNAYLAAGAREVWVVAEDGTIDILNEQGAQPASVFGIAITPPKSSTPSDSSDGARRRGASVLRHVLRDAAQHVLRRVEIAGGVGHDAFAGRAVAVVGLVARHERAVTLPSLALPIRMPLVQPAVFVIGLDARRST